MGGGSDWLGYIIPLGLLILATPLVVALLRANELFALRYRAGKLRIRRGRVPARLLRDIGDVLRHADVSAVDLRGVVEDGRAVLYADGTELAPDVRQQLRNTISLWPVPKIRNAPRKR